MDEFNSVTHLTNETNLLKPTKQESCQGSPGTGFAMESQDIRACRRSIDSSESEALRRIKIYQLSGCDLTPRLLHLSYEDTSIELKHRSRTPTRISLSRTQTGGNIKVFRKRQRVLPSVCTVVHRSHVISVIYPDMFVAIVLICRIVFLILFPS